MIKVKIIKLNWNQKVNRKYLKIVQILINQKNMKMIEIIEIALDKHHQILINQIITWEWKNKVSHINFLLKIHNSKKIINI